MVNWESEKQKKMAYNVFYVFFISGMCAQPLGSFIPFLREAYGFDYDAAGVLLSMQSIGNLISIFMTGILTTFIGRRKSVLAASSWMTVAYLIMANNSPFILIAAAFLMTGIARAGNSNFGNTLISTIKEPAGTQAYNIFCGTYAIGAFISPLLLLLCVNLLGDDNGWRIMAVILCLLASTQIVVYSKMYIPEMNKSTSGKKFDYSFLKIRKFQLGGLGLFLYIAAEYSAVGWLVTYFQDTEILSDGMSQVMSSLLWLMIFIGRIVGSVLTAKISKNKILRVNAVCFLLFLLVLVNTANITVIAISLIGLGLAASTIFPLIFSIGSSDIKGNDLGCSMLVFISSLGGTIAPMIVGFIAENFGISIGMNFIVVIAVALLVAIMVITNANKEQKAEKSA